MRELTVVTANQDGTHRFPLHALGTVSGFSLGQDWPGGCTDASFSLDVPVTFSHFSLLPGRVVVVEHAGLPVWRGVLDTPEVGRPWTIHCVGLASLADTYQALDSDGFTCWDTSVAIPQAITRGLPWLNATSLPNPFISTGTVAATTVAAITGTVASGTSAGATSITISASVAPSAGRLLTIGADQITSYTVSGTGPYTISVPGGIPSAHANGDAVSFAVTSISVNMGVGQAAPLPGQLLTVGTGTSKDRVAVSAVTGTGPYVLTVPTGLTYAHGVGDSLFLQPGGAAGSVQDLLNAVSDNTGQRWGVDANGQLVMKADATTPTWYVLAVDKPGGRTVDNYITNIYGVYIDVTSTPPVRRITAASNNPSTTGAFGKYEDAIDLTPLGPMGPVQARQFLAGILAKTAARASFTGASTLQAGAVTTGGMQPVPLTVVRAGDCVKFLNVEPDPAFGEPSYTVNVTVVAGRLAYDSDSDVLQLAPVQAKQRDLGSILAAALKQ